jgi:spore coat polysaccharide biosynthesis protein SpsF
MDTEVISRSLLKEAFENATIEPEREHVTYYFYTHPDRYRLGIVRSPTNLSQHRWTVDVPEDFELISRLIAALYPKNPQFKLKDVLDILDIHPEWSQINQHIQQKPVDAPKL